MDSAPPGGEQRINIDILQALGGAALLTSRRGDNSALYCRRRELEKLQLANGDSMKLFNHSK